MKPLLLFLLLASSAYALPPTDKVAHAGIGCAISLSVMTLAYQVPDIPHWLPGTLGLLAAWGASEVKEIADADTTRYDTDDRNYTLGGGLFGVSVGYGLVIAIQNRKIGISVSF